MGNEVTGKRGQEVDGEKRKRGKSGKKERVFPLWGSTLQVGGRKQVGKGEEGMVDS